MGKRPTRRQMQAKNVRETRLKAGLRQLIGTTDIQKEDWNQDLERINRLPWHLRRLFFMKQIPGVLNRDRNWHSGMPEVKNSGAGGD